MGRFGTLVWLLCLALFPLCLQAREAPSADTLGLPNDYRQYLDEAVSADPATARQAWARIAASLERDVRNHPDRPGPLRDLIAAYSQLLPFERGTSRESNLSVLIPSLIYRYEGLAPALTSDDARFFHKALMALYAQAELYPLAVRHAAQLGDDPDAELVRAALSTLGQGSFRERETFDVRGEISPYRVTVYEAVEPAPDPKILFHRWYFTARPADESAAPGQVWYTLSSQALGDAPRHYLYGRGAGLRKVLWMYGRRAPGYGEVKEKVRELMVAALRGPAAAPRASWGMPGSGGVLVASAGAAGFGSPGSPPAGTAPSGPSTSSPLAGAEAADDDLLAKYEQARAYVAGKSGEPGQGHLDAPAAPPAAPDPGPVAALAAPALAQPLNPAAAAPVRQIQVGTFFFERTFRPVEAVRQQMGERAAAETVRQQVGGRIVTAAAAAGPIVASPSREPARLRYRVGLALQQLYGAAGEAVPAQGERPLGEPLPEIGRRLRDEAAGARAFDGSRERQALVENGAGMTGTRFFSDGPRSLDDASKLLRTSRFPGEVPPPPMPQSPVANPEFRPGGVMIAVDEAAVDEALRRQGEPATLAEIESLEETLIAAGDAGTALKSLAGWVEQKQRQAVDTSAKLREVDGVRLVSLKSLLGRLSAYRGRWKERPAELRTVGGLTRIYGFVRRDGDLLLAGPAEPGKPAVQVDNLLVGLKSAWLEGATPGCSLDPEPNNVAGPQYSAIIGVPADSSFAKVMLEADYAMKRILFGASGEELEIPGYRSLADLGLDNLPSASTRSRYWLFPAQPGPRAIQLDPGGRAGLFEARVQVLTEAMAVTERGLVGLGESSRVDEEAASLFTRHYDAIAARRPIFRELQGLFDIVLLAKVLRRTAPQDPLLSAACALPYEPAAVPKSYTGLTVRHERNGALLILSGGCDIRTRSAGRAMIACRSRGIRALDGAGGPGASLLLPEPDAHPPAGLERAYSHGASLLADEQFAEACEAFTHAIALDPEFAAAYSQRAVARFRLGEREEAITDAAAAALMDPADLSLRATFHRLAMEAGVPGALDGVAAATRKEIAAQYMAAAGAAETTGAHDAAFRASSFAIEAEPSNSLACAQRAAIRLFRRDLDGALADADQAVRSNPREILALQIRGTVRFFRAEFPAAAADMDRVIAARPELDFIGLRGLIRLLAGDVAGAADDADRCARQDPSSQSAQQMMMAVQMCARVGPRKTRELMVPMLRLPPEILVAFGEGFEAAGAGQPGAALEKMDRVLLLLDQRRDDPTVKAAPLFRDQVEIFMMMQIAPAGGPAAEPALAPPPEPAAVSPRERLEQLYAGLHARHPEWVSPPLARAVALQRLGERAEAFEALEACRRLNPARDPLAAPMFGAGDGSFEGFVLLIQLGLVAASGDFDRMTAAVDRITVVLKDSPALPACLGTREIFTAMRTKPDARAAPPALLESLRRRQRELGDLSRRPLPALDAFVVGLFTQLLVQFEGEANDLAGAEAAARTFLGMRVADELSPFLQGLPPIRAAVCRGLMRFYANSERVDAFMRANPELVRTMARGTENFEQDPAILPGLYQQALAGWIRRAEAVGEPALTMALEEQVRSIGRSPAAAVLEARVRRLEQLRDVAADEAGRQRLETELAAAVKRRDGFRQAEGNVTRATIRAAYGQAKTLMQSRTLDIVLAEAAQRAADPELYRPPRDLATFPLRACLRAVAERYGDGERPGVKRAATAPVPRAPARKPGPSPAAGTRQVVRAPAAPGTPPSPSPSTRAPAPASAAKPTLDAWPTAPGGPAWDALAWVPVLEPAEVEIFDYSSLRRERSHWLGMQSLKSLSVVWVKVVRGLGIPETSLREVISLRPREAGDDPVLLCRTNLPAEELARLLSARGLAETSVAGERAWVVSQSTDSEAGAPGVVLAHGWLLVPGGQDRHLVERVLNVRAGKEPSARTAKGVPEVVAALPRSLPVELSLGIKADSGPPVRAAGHWRDAASPRELAAIAFGTAEGVQMLRERAPQFFPPEVRIESRALVARIHLPDARRMPGEMEGVARGELRQLAESVRRYREAADRYPAAEEGLRALVGDGDYLNAFLGEVPADPWGTPYVYVYPHPSRPETFLLRSAGPDRKRDTADDLLEHGDR